MYISEVRLGNWRNFDPGSSIPLGPITAISGPTGSGRTNFLDALFFLRNVAFCGLGGAMDFVTGGFIDNVNLYYSQRSWIHIGATICDHPGANWDYDLRFREMSSALAYSTRRRSPITRRATSKSDVMLLAETLQGPDGKTLLSRPNERDDKDPECLLQPYLWCTSENRPYRIIRDYLAAIKYSDWHHRIVLLDPWDPQLCASLTTLLQETAWPDLAELRVEQQQLSQVWGYRLRQWKGEHFRPMSTASVALLNLASAFALLLGDASCVLLVRPEIGFDESDREKLNGWLSHALSIAPHASQIIVATDRPECFEHVVEATGIHGSSTSSEW